MCRARNALMSSTNEQNPARLQLLVLDRTAPHQNMARFYVLSIEPTLFGDTALVREWGRWGRQGRRRLDLYASVDGAVEALEDWLRRKMKRGYQVLRCEDYHSPLDLSP